MNPREQLLTSSLLDSSLELPTCLSNLIIDYLQEYKVVPLSENVSFRDLWLCSDTMALRVTHVPGMLLMAPSPSNLETFNFPTTVNKTFKGILLFEYVDTTHEMLTIVERELTYRGHWKRGYHHIKCERWLQFLCWKLKMKAWVNRDDWREELD